MKDRTEWKDAGAWLRDLRIAAEITERELAEQVGAPAVYWIEEIEAGRRAMPVAFYMGYARAFGVPVGAFAARCVDAYGAEDRPIGVAA